MSDDLALAPKNWQELTDMSKTLATASILPAALKQSPANLMLVIMTGRELGMGPLQSIRGIHIIEGRPTLSADTMAGLCLRHSDVCEYITLVKSTDTDATYRAKRKGSAEPVTMGFTIEQAKTAGLASKSNWKSYPAAMLRARALAAITRAVFPDLVAGIYDPDELAPDAPSSPTPVVSTTEAVVDSIKVRARRMKVVDVPEAPALPPTTFATGPVIGYGPNASRRLADLEDSELAWLVSKAKTKSETESTTELGGVWSERLAMYAAESSRRLAASLGQEASS